VGFPYFKAHDTILIGRKTNFRDNVLGRGVRFWYSDRRKRSCTTRLCVLYRCARTESSQPAVPWEDFKRIPPSETTCAHIHSRRRVFTSNTFVPASSYFRPVPFLWQHRFHVCFLDVSVEYFQRENNYNNTTYSHAVLHASAVGAFDIIWTFCDFGPVWSRRFFFFRLRIRQDFILVVNRCYYLVSCVKRIRLQLCTRTLIVKRPKTTRVRLYKRLSIMTFIGETMLFRITPTTCILYIAVIGPSIKSKTLLTNYCAF